MKKRGRVLRGRADRHITRLFKAMQAYLRSIGWDAVLAGPIRVTSLPTSPKGKYTVEIDFLGGKKKPR